MPYIRRAILSPVTPTPIHRHLPGVINQRTIVQQRVTYPHLPAQKYAGGYYRPFVTGPSTPVNRLDITPINNIKPMSQPWFVPTAKVSPAYPFPLAGNYFRTPGFPIQNPLKPLPYCNQFRTTSKVIQQLPRMRPPADTFDNLTVNDLPAEDQFRLSKLYDQNRDHRTLASSNNLEKQLSVLSQQQPVQLTVDQQKIFKRLNNAPIDLDVYEDIVKGPYTSFDKSVFFQNEQKNRLQLSKNLDKWFKEGVSFQGNRGAENNHLRKPLETKKTGLHIFQTQGQVAAIQQSHFVPFQGKGYRLGPVSNLVVDGNKARLKYWDKQQENLNKVNSTIVLSLIVRTCRRHDLSPLIKI